MTSALSAICGTHLGETKLVTSISLSPASCRRCTRPILTSAGTGSFSFCRPSRGPTSTSLTLSGSFMGSVSSLRVNHTGDGLSPLQGADLPGDLRDALLAQGARRGVGRDCDLGVAPERMPARAAARCGTRPARRRPGGRCRATAIRSSSTRCAPRATLMTKPPGIRRDSVRAFRMSCGFGRQRQQAHQHARCTPRKSSNCSWPGEALHARHASWACGSSPAPGIRSGPRPAPPVRPARPGPSRPRDSPPRLARPAVGPARRAATSCLVGIEFAEMPDQRMADELGHLHRHAAVVERTTLAAARQLQLQQRIDTGADVEDALEPGCSSRNCCGGAQTTAWSACGAPGAHPRTTA